MKKRSRKPREPKPAPATRRPAARGRTAGSAAARVGLQGLAWISFRALRSAQSAG